LAVKPFIQKGERPELFELLDNEVAVIRVTLDDISFSQLKDRADFKGLQSPRQNLTDSFNLVRERVTYVLDGFNMNYTEWLPGFDLKKELPELNIGDDGYPHLNYDEIIAGMDFNIRNYIDFDFVNDNLELFIYQSNPKFNITKINNKINDLASSQTNFYRRTDEITSIPEPIEDQLNTNNNYDTQIMSLYGSIINSNITLFNGVTIDRKSNESKYSKKKILQHNNNNNNKNNNNKK